MEMKEGKKEVNDDVSNLTKKALYFMKEKITVHIKLKNNFFYNGLILEVAENEFLLLMDRVNGETPIFFSEMRAIDVWREKPNDMF